MIEKETNSPNLTGATIALLILFFPLGLFLMWFKTRWSMFIKLGITAFLGFVLIGIFGNSHTINQANTRPIPTTNNISSTSAPTPTPTPAKPKSLEEKVKSALPESMKDAEVATDDAALIKNGTVTETLIPSKKVVLLTKKLGNGFWDVNAAKQGVWQLTTETIKSVFPVDTSIYSITLIAEAPVTTAYGKNDFTTLETVTFTRDTFNQIAFKGFDYHNIPTIADIYVENHNLK